MILLVLKYRFYKRFFEVDEVRIEESTLEYKINKKQGPPIQASIDLNIVGYEIYHGGVKIDGN